MKDLGIFYFCLSLQIEHFPNGVLVHQSTYIKKILKGFYMDKSHLLTFPIVVWSLDVKKNPFWPWKKCEELLSPKVPYISAWCTYISCQLYMSKHCFFYQFISKIKFHFNSKTLKWYQTYIVLSLQNYWCRSILLKEIKQQLLGYVDAGYLSYPHKDRS